MSGSKPSRPQPPPREPCANLVFNATVNSPQPTVLARLAVGDVLTVQIVPGQNTVGVFHQNQLVGVITGAKVARLIDCINSAFKYKATITTLSGGQCVVQVEHV